MRPCKNRHMDTPTANKVRLVDELAGDNPLAARELRLLLKLDRPAELRSTRRPGGPLY